MLHNIHIVLYAIVVTLLATGCAPKDPFPPQQHYTSSAIQVPFIAPRSELCGSTSIEMVSSYWQSTSTYVPKLSTEDLDNHTLIPAKGGTLQIEMITVARANGLIAYVLEPTYEALFAELSAHHPVIVLVNRSFSWHPLWHYAPVIGYDEQKRSIIVHFSQQPNEEVPLATFAALWKRSGNWGIILLPPAEIPASISSKAFLHAAYEFEKSGEGEGAVIAYKSALMRWPEDTDILFALANGYYNISNLHDAEETYRKLLSIDPSHPLALNNLALLLCQTHRGDEALKLLDKVVSDDPQIQSMVKSSRKEIEAGCITFSKK